MDMEKYRDIAPYKGQDFEEKFQSLMTHDKEIAGFLSAVSSAPGDPEKLGKVVQSLSAMASHVHSYTDFQKVFTAGFIIPAIVQSSVRNFTTSGAEKLDPNKAYLFISNHRDIVLDCTFADYALLLAGKPLCEMAVGDNLMQSEFIGDLLRLNGGIIVKRDLPMREKYKETVRLSEYFVGSVTEENTSIWVAQKSGRSKNGIDETHPAIIKMLYISQKSKGISFTDLIKKVNIVPISISYQHNPNDINMGREEVAKVEKGSYTKRKYEDVISMVKGLKGFKGDVHVAFGETLTGDYATPDEVAHAIDLQIHRNYRLYDTNYFAYDFLAGIDENKEKYADLDTEKFLGRLGHLSPSVRDFVLSSYANPVRNYLKAIEEEA